MSKKLIVGIVIVLVVIGGWLYISMRHGQKNNSTPLNQGMATSNTQGGNNVSATNPGDTSNAAIDSGLSSIDTQMNGLNSDSTDVNNSLTTN